MKVAVTGATGFIGRHIVKELLRRGEDVVILTSDRAKVCLESRKLEVYEFDVAGGAVCTYSEIGYPDSLIHLAWGELDNYWCRAHYDEVLPAQYQFLEKVVETGLPSLTVAGSCLEYGLCAGALQESMLASPSTPYAFAKDALRRQLEFLRNEFDFKFSWPRLFFVYGEDQGRDSLFSLLKKAAERGDKTFYMSEGEQLRDFLHVDVVAKHIASIATGGVEAGIVNVCSGKPVSVRRMVEYWIREYDLTIEIELGYYPYRAHEHMAFWGDDTKLLGLVRDV